MGTSDWINLIAAILVGGGTLFLGIMAWRTIRQTRSIQKAEKRERLLNEILEWAMDVSNIPFMSFIPKYREITDMWESKIMTAADLLDKYFELENRGEYIRQIAFKLEHGLGNVVGEVVTNIKERELLLSKSMATKPSINLDEMQKVLDISAGKVKTLDGLSEDEKNIIALGRNAGALKKSTSKVIEEVTKTKTKDIG